MMTTVILLAMVIVLEAVPVSNYLRTEYDGEPLRITPLMILAFLCVIAICTTATVVPLSVGLAKMETFEFS